MVSAEQTQQISNLDLNVGLFESGQSTMTSVDLIDETERCAQLGIPYLVTHLGSHLGTGDEAGIKKLVKGLTKAGKVKNDADYERKECFQVIKCIDFKF